MNRNSQIFILCEDTVHYHFAREYFKQIGFDKRKISGNYNQKGISTGSGEWFVKTEYEKEVKAFLSKSSYLSYILVVIIDDDTKNINDEPKNRVRDLHRKYTPSLGENILIFSPVRNIESWFCYIDTGNGNVEIPDADGEIKDYKNQYKYSKPTKFAKKLKNEICLNGLPQNAPSSLQHACSELDRLKN